MPSPGAISSPSTILIIDDTPANVGVLAESLGGDGLAVIVAQDGEEGVTRAEYAQPDLILLDVMLPGIDGFETCRRLKHNRLTRDIPVIFMTALSDIGDKIVGLGVGGVDYVTKPFHADEVRARVRTHLALRAMRQQLSAQNLQLQREVGVRLEAEAALQRAHAELEARVAQRTAELARGNACLSEENQERRLAEQLARQREQEFRTLAENLPDIVIRYDGERRVRYANPAYERALGLRQSGALDAAAGAPQAGAAPYLASLAALLAGGDNAEILLSAADSHYAFHLVAERGPGGAVAGALAIGRDVTALIQAERRYRESQTLLRELAASSEAVREDERKYLTREIHDELGQYLSALRLGVSMLGLEFGARHAPLQAKVDGLVGVVDATIKVVRDIVAAPRPAALDLGIVSALEWLAEEFTGRTGIDCELHAGADCAELGELELDEQRATAVFRIVQESLTNISRHAGASRVGIALRRDGARLVLRVHEDGCGFDPDVREEKSFGLVCIRERALMLGGELEIASAPGAGTTIVLSLPLRHGGQA